MSQQPQFHLPYDHAAARLVKNTFKALFQLNKEDWVSGGHLTWLYRHFSPLLMGLALELRTCWEILSQMISTLT